MSTVIFFSIPAHGHTNPTLPLVQELVKAGEKVIYYSSEEFRSKVEATGAQYKSYSFLTGGAAMLYAGKNMAALYYGLEIVTFKYIDDLINDIRQIKPDYIIHDSICVWGRYAAALCKIPAMTSISTFAFSNKVKNAKNTIDFFKRIGFTGIRKIIQASFIQKKMYKKYGIAPRSFIDSMMNEEPLNIVYNSALFQPHSEYYDTEKYKFIGPMISKRKNDPDGTDYSVYPQPFIYVSMGTIWKNTYSIHDIIEALDGIYGTLVFSGASDEEETETYPDNIIVKKRVNQLEILKHTDVFITHGGMNSVDEGLYNTVPLCVYPFQSEQEEVALRVSELKCGILLKDLRAETVRKAVEKVLSDEQYKENCKKIAQSFSNALGCKGAAQEIIRHFPSHSEYTA